jgi:hypothetical protein
VRLLARQNLRLHSPARHAGVSRVGAVVTEIAMPAYDMIVDSAFPRDDQESPRG